MGFDFNMFNNMFNSGIKLGYGEAFLLAIGLIWIAVAVIQDFRKREVANWWNFSLIVFALAFRAFVAVNNSNIWFFYWGLIGLALGFVLSVILIIQECLQEETLNFSWH